jgi:hypothetical protein
MFMNKERLLELAGITEIHLNALPLSKWEGVTPIVSLIRKINNRDALLRIEQVLHDQMDSISAR